MWNFIDFYEIIGKKIYLGIFCYWKYFLGKSMNLSWIFLNFPAIFSCVFRNLHIKIFKELQECLWNILRIFMKILKKMSNNRYQHLSCLCFGSRSDVDNENKLSGPRQFDSILLKFYINYWNLTFYILHDHFTEKW